MIDTILPKVWKISSLGDSCSIHTGYGFPTHLQGKVTGQYPFYKVGDISKNVRNGCIFLNKCDNYIDDIELSDLRAKLLPVNCIVFAKIGAALKLNRRAITQTPCLVDNNVIGVKAKDSQLLDLYLYYYLKTIDMGDYSRETTVPSIRSTDIEKIEIPLPPLAEQKRIADILNTASGLIKKRKEQIRLIDQLAKSLFVEMFGDPVENPMGWETLDLKNITLKIGSGATPRGGKESYISEGICLIRSMNVHNGRFKYNDLAHITKEQAKQLDVVTLKEYDVLINITGASVARSCIVPRDILPARVNQHVSILRCNPTNVKPEYLSQLLINENYQISLLDISRGGGATREAITKLQLEHLPIPLPPLSLQQEFTDRIDAIENQKVLFETGLEKLEMNYQALMQEYFG